MYSGAEIKTIRELLGWTQQELCVHLGVAISTVRYWEQHPEQLIKSKYEDKLADLTRETEQVQLEQNLKTVGPKAEGLIKKIVQGAGSIAHDLVIGALKLYYCTVDENTPKRSRTIALAALAYFIFPLDAIPDMIPIVGYTDDMAMIAGSIGSLAVHLTPEHQRKAEKRLDEILS